MVVEQPVVVVSKLPELELEEELEEELGEELVEFIDYAVDGSHRMQGMLDGLLRYSRALKSPPTTEQASLHDAYEKAARAIPGGEVVRWQGEHPTVEASSDHLVMILRELLSNALKFADPETPVVTVECAAEGHNWSLSITDNGSGVPEGSVEQCFRLFGRLHGRDEMPGLGIGLTVAQCLAEKYDAQVRLGNAPGGGRATLLWPAKSPGVADLESQTEARLP